MEDFQKMHICTPRKFQNFNEFSFKVGTTEIDTYVIMTENYAQNDGSTAKKVRVTGLSVEVLKLVCEKKNLTTVSFAPSLNMEFDSFVKAIAELE